MKKNWQVHNNGYYLRDISSNQPVLTRGVYNVQVDPNTGELFLKKMSEEFKFDFKIYGLESRLITKVMKTYASTKGNLGVILNGTKGTGKTITAEVIANKTELPIILVGENYAGITNFLSDIHQDVVIFIDEYEKTFKGCIGEDDFGDRDDRSSNGDSTLLGLMDGTYKTEFRKMFLLTTNRIWVNDNMLNRPGRIRYLKGFGDLELDQIIEIVDDCLKEKKFRQDILDYLKLLKLITVDIVKAVVSEVNIYKEPPMECCKEMNVEFRDVEYKIHRIVPGKKKDILLDEHVKERELHNILNIRGGWKGKYIGTESGTYYLADKPNHKDRIYTVNESGIYDPSFKGNFKIKITKETSIHGSFMY